MTEAQESTGSDHLMKLLLFNVDYYDSLKRLGQGRFEAIPLLVAFVTFCVLNMRFWEMVKIPGREEVNVTIFMKFLEASIHWVFSNILLTVVYHGHSLIYKMFTVYEPESSSQPARGLISVLNLRTRPPSYITRIAYPAVPFVLSLVISCYLLYMACSVKHGRPLLIQSLTVKQ